MNYPWIIRGLSMDYLRIIHGFSMDYPWIFHGYHGHPNWLFVKLAMPFPIPASQNSQLAGYI